MNSQSGIYCIRNTINNKVYIGSAVNLHRRKNQHFSDLRRNKHINKYLQASFIKHGEDVFLFEVLTCVEDLKSLIDIETRYINLFESHKRDIGYNICSHGKSTLGYKHTDETKEKIRQTRLGKQLSIESKEKISNANLGNKMSIEAKEKMRQSQLGNKNLLGYKFSESSRLKMSESRKKEKNSFYGKKHTQETKEKISNSKMGKNVGESNKNSKLNKIQVKEIKILLREGLSDRKIAKLYNVTNITINYIRNNKTWKHVIIEEEAS